MNQDFQRIQPGTNVYGSDGAKVGDVAELGTNYLLVQKGWLFVTDRYIPFSAISHVDADGVYLTVAKDEIDSQGWDEVPAEDTTTFTHERTASYTAGRADADVTAGRADFDTRDEATIPVVEEEIRIGKRDVEQGGVRVHTHVEETPVHEEVTLRDEHVDVERRPVDRPLTDADAAAFREGSFEVRERDEEAVVDKQARVVEEVSIRKDVDQRTETVDDTVRRTDVDVEQLGGERRTSYTETGTTGTAGYTGTTDEGTIERNASRLGNAAERGTGVDLDRDGDVGQRDPRNND
jgi:uncharacterized protein (TIGR02271 family)